ncbi:MAG TPA: Glu/Leu/Phe/Val dehydrogenase dimerization domain-containing protein [Burkholderiales bacterium]|nr:Glu/Leu/Phe/Val dehydrogenase dimerization domain-containing protein [Burkholderiales bacterium]
MASSPESENVAVVRRYFDGCSSGDLAGSARHAFHAELKSLKDYFDAMAPELEVTVRDPALAIEGYVVVWNTGISIGGPLEGCGKGGTRITPQVSLDEVKMLARTMALKNAAAGLPLGGAKSGLKLDPSAPGFESRYRRFVRLCAPLLYENGGAFGGFGFDIGARPEHALWACDELKSTRCFTGKPLSMGGTDYDREGIAGLGVAVAGSTMLEVKGESAATAAFAVQGMGAMGAAVLRYFGEAGARLAALGDPKYEGSWTFDQPLSADLRRALVRQDTGEAKALLPREGKKISGDASDVLYQRADILFPCAVQNVIVAGNVDRIQARYVCEGANGPVADEARASLHSRGIPLVPDFIANPGGVVAAFVELTSESPNKAEEAKALTREKIAANVRELFEIAERYGAEPQDAGLYMALAKIRDTSMGRDPSTPTLTRNGTERA